MVQKYLPSIAHYLPRYGYYLPHYGHYFPHYGHYFPPRQLYKISWLWHSVCADIIINYNLMMRNNKAKTGKDQLTFERMAAQSLAQRYPLFEDGRNVVGFLQIMSKQLTERITDLLRGHSREMQGEIADSIRIYVVYQAIDLTGIKHVDNELLEIFDMFDQYKY